MKRSINARLGLVALLLVVAQVTSAAIGGSLLAIESEEPTKPVRGGHPLDWRPLHYKIYATHGEPMEPAKLRKKMQKLLEFYKSHVDTPSADRNMRSRIEKLEKLANSASFSGGNSVMCQWDKMNELTQLIEYNQPFQVNVIPYLQTNRRKLVFGFCGDVLHAQFQEALKRVSGAQDEALVGEDFFDIMVLRPKVEELVSSDAKLASRVNELLEARQHISKDSKAKRIGDATYDTYFDQMVSTSCDIFEMKLREIVVDKYHLLELGADLFESSQELYRKWFRYSQVCNSLEENKQEIMSKARLEFQDKYIGRDSFIRG